MTYEQKPTPEYFENAHTLGEVMAEYERLTTQAVIEHQSRFVNVVATHEAAFNQEAKAPGSENIDDVMENTKTTVECAVVPVVEQVDGIILAASNVVSPMLDARSQQLLAEAKSTASTYGTDSRYVDEVLDKASGDGRTAIKIALDAAILEQTKKNVATYGADSMWVRDTVSKASMPFVRSAILVTLDAAILEQAKKNAATFGGDSMWVRDTVSKASMPTIRAAMRVTFDADILLQARKNAATFGGDSMWVKESLSHASSETVLAVFKRQFPGQQSSGHRTSSHENNNNNAFGFSFSENDVIRDVFRLFFGNMHTGSQRSGSSNSRQTNNQQRGIREEATSPSPDRDVEVDNIVAQVTGRHRQYGWIRQESSQDIRQVINNVRQLRANGEASGVVLSDRKVYLKYRAEAETNPKLIKSVQILEALMGGNINGKLPF